MLFAGIALLALFAASTPVSGGTPTPPDELGIPPVVWELVELTGDSGEPVAIDEPANYTVQFQPGGDMAIKADCNQARGMYTLDESVLDITLTVSTLALCPPESQHDAFRTLLEDAERFEFDQDGYLTLIGPGGNLRFRTALTGVVWEWQDFRGGDDSVIAPDDPQHYTLTFLPDGMLAIRADCNRARGTFTADPPKIDLKMGGMTRMMCPEGSLMDRYLRDLEAASSYVFREGNLYLALPADAGIMAFEARYVAPEDATPEAG